MPQRLIDRLEVLDAEAEEHEGDDLRAEEAEEEHGDYRGATGRRRWMCGWGVWRSGCHFDICLAEMFGLNREDF